jgi:sortase A
MSTAKGSPNRFRAKTSRILHGAFYVFLVAGIFAIGYAGYMVADAYSYQSLEATKFELPVPALEPNALAQGDVIGEITVPRLGLNAIVVQGDSVANLRHAVGHISNTSLPGEPGNVALAGHRDSFFRPLRKIQPGDAITIRTRQGTVEYRVESTEVILPSGTQVLRQSRDNILTLITCYPFYYVGAAAKRFIVHARQVELVPAEFAAPDMPLRF